MLRLVGGVLIFAVSTYCGFYLSGRLRTRVDFLRAMGDALSFISSEIEFGHYELADIFNRITIPVVSDFFKVCAKFIKHDGVRQVWEREVLNCNVIKREDADILMQLGNQLGRTDVEGQKNAISRAISGLDKNAKSANEEYIRLGKTYKECGALLGLFFMIILI